MSRCDALKLGFIDLKKKKIPPRSHTKMHEGENGNFYHSLCPNARASWMNLFLEVYKSEFAGRITYHDSPQSDQWLGAVPCVPPTSRR
jgi:hypothetical protein